MISSSFPKLARYLFGVAAGSGALEPACHVAALFSYYGVTNHPDPLDNRYDHVVYFES
jgi:hypothetical protein